MALQEQESDDEENPKPKRKKNKNESVIASSDGDDQGSVSGKDTREGNEREGTEEIEEIERLSTVRQRPKPRPAWKGKAAQHDVPGDDHNVDMEDPAEPVEVSDGLDEHESSLAYTLRSQAPTTPKKAKTLSGPLPAKSNKELAKGPTTRGRKASEATRAPAEASFKPSSSKKIMEVAITKSPTRKRKDDTHSKTAEASKTDTPWFASSTSSDAEDRSDDGENDSEKGNDEEEESEESEAEIMVEKTKGKAPKSKRGRKKGKHIRAQASALPDSVTPAKNMGQAYLRLHIALNTAWTKYAAMADDRLQDREQVMQKVMHQVKAHHDRDGRRPKQIRAAIDEIKGDSEEVQTLRKALTDVVWTAASQMRNDLKKRAKQVIEEAYDMSTLQPKRKEALAAWLTRSYKQPLRGSALVSVPYFIFGDIKIAWNGEGRKAALDEKGCSVNLKKPFQHPAIWQLVHVYWFSGSGNSELKAPRDQFSQIPNNLIALVCNALEAALRDFVQPDMQFSNKVYAPKWDDHMALLEEIERAKPDVFAGIKRRIWEKVSSRLAEEDNVGGTDLLGLMEGGPKGIPFDDIVVDEDEEESEKEVDELEGSVPPQQGSVGDAQEQLAADAEATARSQWPANTAESRATGRPVAASIQVVSAKQRMGPSAVISRDGTSGRDAAEAMAHWHTSSLVNQAVKDTTRADGQQQSADELNTGRVADVGKDADGAGAADETSPGARDAGPSQPAR
ncbi:hypothetical protein FOMPIDRAFT_1056478 [Fomitopsis schrenkii]|uniref:DUF6532 domain-containing protein n=1 Tax=Fomitopsis schrenkii TaxID=2126942 RepID=S8ET21_FOMSC|nr:hypothetical protein FOMPIDRAFT_1056478 [Fomitopsis schrenkii]